jgi:hypothetical protein
LVDGRARRRKGKRRKRFGEHFVCLPAARRAAPTGITGENVATMVVTASTLAGCVMLRAAKAAT